MATSTGSGWAWLPELALDLIFHKLQFLSDCVRFASVCPSWRISAKNAGNKQFPVPMLLLIQIEETAKTISLYSVQEKKTYHVQHLPLDENRLRFCCGSSHGWLIMVERDLSITLTSPNKTNPQRATIRLPPITTINDLCFGQRSGDQESIKKCIHIAPQLCVHKVILSANPTTTRDYVVVAIYGLVKQLAILRSGDDNWTYLDKSLGLFNDAAWHKNKLYAATQLGHLMQIDGVTSKNLSPSMVHPINYPEKTYDPFYLVESSRGELLVVERYTDPTMQDQSGRSGFKVHRLDMSPTEEKKIRHPKVWPVGDYLHVRVSEKANRVEVKEIGGDALFLGDNYLVAVAASEMCQCRGNWIYYCTKHTVASEMGIFCLENGKFETHHSPNLPHGFQFSIWFTPILSDWI